MDSFPSSYANRHTLSFATTYTSPTSSIPDKLSDNIDATNNYPTKKIKLSDNNIKDAPQDVDSQHDNQQVIFESLSTTGKELLIWHQKMNHILGHSSYKEKFDGMRLGIKHHRKIGEAHTYKT
eukprot:15364654-Ditylum_brightwellii.AAC.1